MDGMIFAAGLGTRLKPLTDRTPKALIEVGGRTLLERTIDRLAGAGCDRIVINVHHHAERIIEFLRAGPSTPGLPGAGHTMTASASGSMPEWCGAEIMVSVETDAPLETGGGLKHAAGLLRRDRTILVHNVDVISSVDLRRMVRAHEESAALATLAVNRRSATRYLVFDERGLCGRVDTRTGTEEWARSPSEPQWRAGFTGVQALSSVILDQLSETGRFSIMESYLRLAATGARILPHDVTGATWFDVGTPERLEVARASLAGR